MISVMKNKDIEKSVSEYREILELEEKAKAEALKSGKPNRFTHNRYRIFHVEEDPETGAEKKITMKRFWAKNDEEALAELNEYRKIANKQYTYYYGDSGYYVDHVRDPKTGKLVEHRYDSFEEMMKAEDSRKSFLKKIWNEALFQIDFHWDKIKDIGYWFRDLFYWIKTTHNRNESWSLDMHIISDILHNIPLLIENKQGTPTEFCLKAVKLLHKDDKDFDVDKAFKENPNITDEGHELGTKLWNEELNKLLLYARLYCYYRDYGIVDDADVEMKKIEAEYEKTLPYKPGTYKSFDYAKLDKLKQTNWNAMWNWIKQYGEALWD